MKINPFIAQATKLTRLGDRHINKNRTKHFHLEAERLLRQCNLPELFDYQGLITAVYSKKFQVEQNFKALEFSDLPITVARGEHCLIDVYFWRRRPTTIHNHHFCGAFQCIQGSNVDSEFKFKVRQKLTAHHALGDLNLVQTKTIKAGDVVPINLLDKFIHQNHHHDDLTVNLCFRTTEVAKKNLSNYLYSGFRYEKDPLALMRAERLLALTRIQDFDPKKLDISPADAMNFIILNHGSGIRHPRFLKLHGYLVGLVKKAFRLDLEGLIDAHEDQLDKVQSEYE